MKDWCQELAFLFLYTRHCFPSSPSSSQTIVSQSVRITRAFRQGAALTAEPCLRSTASAHNSDSLPRSVWNVSSSRRHPADSTKHVQPVRVRRPRSTSRHRETCTRICFNPCISGNRCRVHHHQWYPRSIENIDRPRYTPNARRRSRFRNGQSHLCSLKPCGDLVVTCSMVAIARLCELHFVDGICSIWTTLGMRNPWPMSGVQWAHLP